MKEQATRYIRKAARDLASDTTPKKRKAEAAATLARYGQKNR